MATLRQQQTGLFTKETLQKLACTRFAWSCFVSMGERTAQEEELRGLLEECLTTFEQQPDLDTVYLFKGDICGYNLTEPH